MDTQIALITGGTGGIGKEVARGLASRNMHVTIVGRTRDKGQQAVRELRMATHNEHIDFIQADLSLMRDVEQVAQQFRDQHDRLDLLVHSAGVIYLKFDRTDEGLERNIASSYLSRFLLTNLLLDLLQLSAPSRVINIAGSRGKGTIDLGHFNSPRYGGMRAHGQAQAANDAWTLEFARRVDGSGVQIAALNPGAVDTDIRREFPQWSLALLKFIFGRNAKTPSEGAELPLWLATAATDINGKLFKPPYQQISVADSMRDFTKLRQVWDASAQATHMEERLSRLLLLQTSNADR
ncbi:MAG: SDR family NAD(P)-dependent oxidoreductase [Chloroflexota bacterium]